MNLPLLETALLALFVAVFLGVELTFLWWRAHYGAAAVRRAKRFDALRSGRSETREETQLRLRLASNVPGLAQLRALFPRLRHVEVLVEQSGVRVSVMAVLMCCVALGTVAGVLGWALLGRVPAFGVGACGAAAPLCVLVYLRDRLARQFELQLPDALDLVARSLRAGHALQNALHTVAQECPAPIGPLFQRVTDEITLGASVSQALRNLARRMPSTDLKFFVIAVLIQRETGGNLAGVLGNLSALIRERVKLIARVQALSAEGRFSGLVLFALPVITGVLLYTVDRDFMSLLWTDDTGLKLLKGAMVLMFFGALWMRAVIRIRV